MRVEQAHQVTSKSSDCRSAQATSGTLAQVEFFGVPNATHYHVVKMEDK